MEKTRSGGGGKIGRNKSKCAEYRLDQKRIKNKIRRLKKQFKKFNEPDIRNRIRKLEDIII